MTTTRPRNAIQTRADILTAARRRFGAEGYERTTRRAIAADVGVDPALVIRYLGRKQDLFAEAADFRIDLPDLTGVDPDEVASIHRTKTRLCGFGDDRVPNADFHAIGSTQGCQLNS